jgi:hypothetical protein
MKPEISSHYSMDDKRHYEFVRDTKLPRGSFDSELRSDMVVLIVAVIALFVGLGATWIGVFL